jgi:hypothetical protein
MIRFPTVLLLAAIAATAAAAQSSVPKIDYEASCRAAAKATGGVIETLDACLGSERAARDDLVKRWSSFPAADRRSCYTLTTTGTPGTYTELLTCLEMRGEARKLPDRDSTGLGLQPRK